MNTVITVIGPEFHKFYHFKYLKVNPLAIIKFPTGSFLNYNAHTSVYSKGFMGEDQ